MYTILRYSIGIIKIPFVSFISHKIAIKGHKNKSQAKFCLAYVTPSIKVLIAAIIFVNLLYHSFSTYPTHVIFAHSPTNSQENILPMHNHLFCFVFLL